MREAGLKGIAVVFFLINEDLSTKREAFLKDQLCYLNEELSKMRDAGLRNSCLTSMRSTPP